jgi:ABC-type sugar transport system ATPase subunit
MMQMLRVTDISKSFGGVAALRGVDLSVEAGEVRALLGSNGAGKSTLMRIIAGAEAADAGTVELAGRPVSFSSPAQAVAAGVAAVYQELSLVPGLTVAENIMLGRWSKVPRTARAVVDMRRVHAQAEEALERLGESLPLRALADDLSVGQQQLVEIAKALSQDPRLLILDEPTSALSREEADRLIALTRGLGARGLAVLYVSHRMDEIARVADSMTIMRDGRVVQTMPTASMPVSQVAALMIGEERARVTAAPQTPLADDERLVVSGLSRRGAFENADLRVRRGEILGIAGLLGSGRTELLRGIFGRDRADEGSIAVDGVDLGLPSERTMIAHRVGFTPEDRKTQGVILGMPIGTNLTLAAFPRFVRRGLISAARDKELSAGVAADLTIKAASLANEVHTLSGGNQQKVVIGKWLAAQAEILLLDEPTRGIDVHAKQQVYELVRALAARGHSIVFVSSELEELFEVCHTIAVMNHGRIVHVGPAAETDLSKTLALAMKEFVPDEH